VAVKRGRSQARRSGGNNGGMPGWAWMVLGIVLTIVVVLAAPKLLKSDGEDGFFRPRPNPDARPAPDAGNDDAVVPETADLPEPAAGTRRDEPDGGTQYDFYTLLPGQEVAMTDAELAASARAEDARQRQLEEQQAAARAAAEQPRNPDAADLATPAPTAPASTAAATTPTTAAAAAGTAAAGDGARYILQAGSFAASGDAEALKARIALLGLSARVESAEIGGRAMYRVRMGPYGTASDLAEAKQKLGNGGLPALAIRAK
jgi:cell division protein FtsN